MLEAVLHHPRGRDDLNVAAKPEEYITTALTAAPPTPSRTSTYDCGAKSGSSRAEAAASGVRVGSAPPDDGRLDRVMAECLPLT
jgi:hypothetical protein